jgi:hypothetical protein
LICFRLQEKRDISDTGSVSVLRIRDRFRILDLLPSSGEEKHFGYLICFLLQEKRDISDTGSASVFRRRERDISDT